MPHEQWSKQEFVLDKVKINLFLKVITWCYEMSQLKNIVNCYLVFKKQITVHASVYSLDMYLTSEA